VTLLVASNTMTWRKIPVTLAELSIDSTLRCGQSFRWRKHGDVWSCALHGRLISLRQDPSHLHYRVQRSSIALAPPTPPASSLGDADSDISTDDDDTSAFLHHYLNLTPDLTSLYAQWSASDSNFAKKAPRFTGIRILRQDAWEALVGFICSSNNNIARISQMVEKLCTNYGPLIGHVDSKPFHGMPRPSSLAKPEVEANLRQLGFGYRAKYIYQTAMLVCQQEVGWLDSLRNPGAPAFMHSPDTKVDLRRDIEHSADEHIPAGGRGGYRAAHEALLTLQGVGPKVADCVCLMGLGWGEAVPVDTHVWQIAQRDYKFGKGKKGQASLTKALYDAVGDHFRALWGKEAGWAHSVLFTADLRSFKDQGKAETTLEIKTDGEVKVKIEEVVVQMEDGEEEVVVKREELEDLGSEIKIEVVKEPLSTLGKKRKLASGEALEEVESRVVRRSRRTR